MTPLIKESHLRILMFLLVKIVMNNISVDLTRELDLLSPFTITVVFIMFFSFQI